MAYIMSLLNQKGGIGKTTASVQIGVGLRRRGYKVLLIDMDPQCNLTFSLGGDYQDSPTIMEAILRETDVNECIQHLDECDLIPSSNNLSTIESQIEESGKEYMLVDAIKNIKEDYDYIIIDSPPTLSLITISIMVVANGIIIPANLDMYSLQGIGQLYRTYDAVKTYCNDKLCIEGILITKSARTLKKTLLAVAQEFGIQVFDNEITNSPLVVNATIEQKSLYKIAPNAQVTKDYNNFVTELLKKHNKPANEEVEIEKNPSSDNVPKKAPSFMIQEEKQEEVIETKKEELVFETKEFKEVIKDEPVKQEDSKPETEKEEIPESKQEPVIEEVMVLGDEEPSVIIDTDSENKPQSVTDNNKVTNLVYDTLNNKIDNKVYKDLEELFDNE